MTNNELLPKWLKHKSCVLRRIIKLKTLKYLLFVALTLTYIFMMLVLPWMEGSLLNTLDKWQTFNSAIIAFIASAIVLQSTKHKEREIKKARYIACRVAMMHQLSELGDYLKLIANVHYDLMVEIKKNKSNSRKIEIPPIEIPSIKQIVTELKDYILVAPLGNIVVVSKMLSQLQYMTARTKSEITPEEGLIRGESYLHHVEGNISEIAEIKALVDRLYPYSRDLDNKLNTNENFTQSEISNALLNLYGFEKFNAVSEIVKKFDNR